MAPLRASTTKSEWLPDDPTAFAPSRLWKLPSITTWDDSRNQNHPTDSAEEANMYGRGTPPRRRNSHLRWRGRNMQLRTIGCAICFVAGLGGIGQNARAQVPAGGGNSSLRGPAEKELIYV